MNDEALQSLLSPVGEASPTGEDLECDADFMALERAAAPKVERAIGDAVKAAEEPDWDRVKNLAEALLSRSKDLRVAVHLSTAWMRTSGLHGWADGLALIRRLLEDYWEGVHPQLDAEDDNDPTARVNALRSIAPTGTLFATRSAYRQWDAEGCRQRTCEGLQGLIMNVLASVSAWIAASHAATL